MPRDPQGKDGIFHCIECNLTYKTDSGRFQEGYCPKCVQRMGGEKKIREAMERVADER